MWREGTKSGERKGREGCGRKVAKRNTTTAGKREGESVAVG